MALPKVGETISAEEFNKLPAIGETISAQQFNALGAEPPQEPQRLSFTGGVKQDIRARGAALRPAIEQAGGDLGVKNVLELGLNIAGQGAGFAGDILGRGLTSVGRFASAVTPDFIERRFKEVAGQELGNILETREGKLALAAIGKGIDAYNKFKGENPRTARNVEAVVNVAALLPIGKAGQLAIKPTTKLAQQTGKALVTSGEAKQAKGLAGFLSELVRPERTATVRKTEVRRTREVGVGPFKSSVIEPTIQEKRAAEALAGIKGIKSKNTFQRNYNVIKESNVQEAKSLESAIAKNDFIYPRQELKAKLGVLKQELAQEPELTGDILKTAEKLVDRFELFVDKNVGKGSGLLKARKEYDSFVKSRKPKAFDPKTENAFSVANREVRQLANDFLENNATKVEVKKSLRKQSSLFNALDNIEAKAATEADTAFLRTLQKLGNTLGTKNRIVQGIAAAVGIGGLGAAATFAPAVAVLGLGGWLVFKSGKLILRPEIRIALGKALIALKKPAGVAGASIFASAVSETRELEDEIKALLKEYD